MLAYLGQIEEGLSASEKRVRSTTEKGSLSLSAGQAELGGSTEEQLSVEQVATQTEADRFYRLLRALRADEAHFHDIDARLTDENAFDDLRNEVATDVEVGDFVRINYALLFLPPFAAVFPRARYAHYLTEKSGRLLEPRRPLYAPISEQERRDVRAYLRSFDPHPRRPNPRTGNPRLPFLLPASAPDSPGDAVEFLIPARYRGLGTEPTLLSEQITVVGKLVYKDMRVASEVKHLSPDEAPPEYTDRQSLTTFGPALKRAPTSLLRNLRLLPREKVVDKVATVLTRSAPVAVIVPVAIYQ